MSSLSSPELVRFRLYGLDLNGDPRLGRRLSLASADSTVSAVELDCHVGVVPSVDAPWRLSDDAAHLRFSAGLIEARRNEHRIVITTHEMPAPEAIVHPYLGFPCAAINRWSGNDSLHGGAFVLNGKAFVLFGARERGKSTLLAALAQRGIEVLTDDLVIIDAAQRVMSGPRCIDLRPDADPSLGGVELNLPNDRGRRRIALPPCPDAVPIAGFVELTWGIAQSMDPMSVSAALRLLDEAQFIPHGPARPTSFLELLALPAWRYTRPQSTLPPSATVDQLIDSIS